MGRCCKLGIMLLCVSGQVFGILSESASDTEADEIIKNRQQKQELSKAEVKQKAENQRQKQNAAIKDQLAGPPTDFHHYSSPPSRRMEAGRTSRVSATSRAHNTQTTVAQSPRRNIKLLFSLSILVAISFFVVTMLVLRSRRRNNTERQ